MMFIIALPSFIFVMFLSNVNATKDCTLKPTDLVFVLDESGSVGEANFQLQNQFVAKLVEGFDIGINNTQVAVMTFASSVVIEFYLNAFNDKVQLLESIKHINYSHPGITMTHIALRTVRNDVFTVANGMRPNALPFVIVVTDGRSMISQATIKEAKLLHDLNITVFAIGISNEVYEDELRGMASDPKDVIIVKDFGSLMSIQEQALRSACKALLKNTNVSSNETETTIPVTTKHTIATTSSPTKTTTTMSTVTSTTTSSTRKPIEITTLPYSIESTSKVTKYCRSKPTDLVFVLDESGSVGEANFQLQNQFVAKLVEGFDIGINNTQVAVMTFASSVVIEFYLNAFNDKVQLLESIKHINYSHPGITMTHIALRTVRNDVFTVANGMRPSALPFVIVVTDGRSMISQATIKEAKLLHDLNITVFAIGISNEVYEDELRGMASDPKDVIIVKDFFSLMSIQENILSTACEAITKRVNNEYSMKDTTDSVFNTNNSHIDHA